MPVDGIAFLRFEIVLLLVFVPFLFSFLALVVFIFACTRGFHDLEFDLVFLPSLSPLGHAMPCHVLGGSVDSNLLDGGHSETLPA